MASSFFFYDLETSGINPRSAQIMQFAGQRTDMDLNPVGEPFNFLIKLNQDIIPDPFAVLVTGITPQKTIQDGISEAEFFKIFDTQINKHDTIFVGFNGVRFDDEFMRFGFYRNFYDPYEWQWKDGKSRWDILDLSRITRALRPDGIIWPFDSDGKPTNRLEYITKINKISHDDAHDALADVNATISLAKLIKTNAPKLFDYQLNLRSKAAVKNFAENNKTFLYVSGQYSSEHEKLAVVQNLGEHPGKKDACLVYDLLVDPQPYLKMTAKELAQTWQYKKDLEKSSRLPVKTMQFNRCPAIAPLSVLGADDKKRLNIKEDTFEKNQTKIINEKDFHKRVCEAIKILDSELEQPEMVIDTTNVDTKLYDGFIGDSDKKTSLQLRQSPPEEIQDFIKKFSDNRLKILTSLYKARNFPKNLSADETQEWEKHKNVVYQQRLPDFIKQMEQAQISAKTSKNDQYVLDELKMYVESLIPSDY